MLCKSRPRLAKIEYIEGGGGAIATLLDAMMFYIVTSSRSVYVGGLVLDTPAFHTSASINITNH